MSLTVNPINYQNTKQPSMESKSNKTQDTMPVREPEIKNKIGTSLLFLTAIGIGTAAYIKIHNNNAAYKKKIRDTQALLKEIFFKDFSINDTKSFIQKHHELTKIKDNSEYYTKLFEQLKTDFQVENKNLALKILEKPIPVSEGVYQGYTEALTREIGTVFSDKRITTIKNLFHEFRHVKQNELMYKTDSARLIKSKVAELEKSNNASWKEILNNYGGDKVKARKFVQNEVEQVYKENWRHLNPIDKASKDYQLGIKYLENEENRIPPGEKYYEQILEKEAKAVEDAVEKLFELIKK